MKRDQRPAGNPGGRGSRGPGMEGQQWSVWHSALPAPWESQSQPHVAPALSSTHVGGWTYHLLFSLEVTRVHVIMVTL